MILQHGYKQAHRNHTLFYKRQSTGITILIVYIDDIVLNGDDRMDVQLIKKRLATEFNLKDLGNLRYILGMEIARNQTSISILQPKYTLDLLKEMGMLGSKPVGTSIDPNIKLETKPEDSPVEKGQYQHLVRKLIYLPHIRPDISIAMGCFSRFMHATSETRMHAINRILKYLKGMLRIGLFFKKNAERGVQLYTGADWAGSSEDRRSTSSYRTFVWGNLVTWRSKKQTMVARSSA